MSGSMRGSDPLRHAAFALRAGAVLALLAAVAVAEDAGPAALQQDGPPARVVSINLCTDQLAMLLAAPGQLVSVSDIARDPLSSAMAAEAMAWPVNHGLAEEVFLLDPDLVLAGTWTSRATVDMLRRLGVPVAEFAPAGSVAEVRQGIVDIGAALGRTAAATDMLADFDARLAALTADLGTLRPDDAPRAALYYANGYTTGEHSLAGDVLGMAGFRNIADEGDLAGRWFIALEELLLADPDLVITGTPYPGASNAEELLRHPALQEFMATRSGAGLADADWVCGTPHVLASLERLVAARRGLAPDLVTRGAGLD